MNPINFLNEFISRLKTEKPEFFKQLQAIALIIGVISGGALGYDYLVAPLAENIDKLATTLFTISTTVYFTGQLPSKDKPAEVATKPESNEAPNN